MEGAPKAVVLLTMALLAAARASLTPSCESGSEACKAAAGSAMIQFVESKKSNGSSEAVIVESEEAVNAPLKGRVLTLHAEVDSLALRIKALEDIVGGDDTAAATPKPEVGGTMAIDVAELEATEASLESRLQALENKVVKGTLLQTSAQRVDAGRAASSIEKRVESLETEVSDL